MGMTKAEPMVADVDGLGHLNIAQAHFEGSIAALDVQLKLGPRG